MDPAPAGTSELSDAFEACVKRDWSKAIRLIGQVIRQRGASPALLCNRALCYCHLELHKHAIKDCNAALALDAAHVPAFLHRGVALAALGKREEASSTWKHGLATAVAKGEDLDLCLRLNTLIGEASAKAAPGGSVEPSGLAPDLKSFAGPSQPAGNGGPASAMAGVVRQSHVAERQSKASPAGAGSSGDKRSAPQKLVQIDLRVSLGISQVNSGRYNDAIKIFTLVIDSDSANVDALIGRGTAHALQLDFDAAINDFTSAIEINPDCSEAYKRRAQAIGNKGISVQVVRDFTRCLELEPLSPEVFYERGLVFLKLKDFECAISDLRACLKLNPDHKQAHNCLGLAYAGLGECHLALEAYDVAVQMDPTNKEAWTNRGQLLRELGRASEAGSSFTKALKIDPGYSPASRLMGLLCHGTGQHLTALEFLERAAELEPSNLEVAYLRASCHHAIGNFHTAALGYDSCLGMLADQHAQKLQFLAFYQREIAFYTASVAHKPLTRFQLDADLDPLFKEAWCKSLPPTVLFPAYTTQPVCSPDQSQRRKEPGAVGQSAACQKLLEAADIIGRHIQNDCPGFLRNARQHRMAGLAAIEVAQLASATWHKMREGLLDSPCAESSPPSSALPLPPGSNSKTHRSSGARRKTPAPASSLNRGAEAGSGANGRRAAESNSDAKSKTADGWRQVYSLAVRWRQLSEPCDPVVWIDMLTEAEFSAGFGSHTPLLLGSSKVVRYYPNFPRVFESMKEQILAVDGAFSVSNDLVALETPHHRRAVSAAQNCTELYDAIGQDFWVVTPCYSVSSPGTVLDGTRLTLQKEGTGFHLSIRTPGTPPRWTSYDRELTAAWKELCEAACAPGDADVDRRSKISASILRLSFYWYNFMPLARGTAVVGYVVLLGLHLAGGWEVSSLLPKGLQVDWEAILSPRLEDFLTSVQPWLQPSLKSTALLEDLPPMDGIITSVAAAIDALSSKRQPQGLGA